MRTERYPDAGDDRAWRGRVMRERQRRQRLEGGYASRHSSREPERRADDAEYPDPRSRAFRDARWADEPDREGWPDYDTDPRERDAWRARRFEGPYDERTVERYRGTVDPGQYFGPDPYRGMERQRAGRGMEERRYAGVGPKGYRRDDARIRDDICDRLTDDPYVDASDVTVTVTNGEVTLEGTVPDRHHKRAAEDSIESVPGVRDINNRLRVQAPGAAPPALP